MEEFARAPGKWGVGGIDSPAPLDSEARAFWQACGCKVAPCTIYPIEVEEEQEINPVFSALQKRLQQAREKAGG